MLSLQVMTYAGCDLLYGILQLLDGHNSLIQLEVMWRSDGTKIAVAVIMH